MKAILLILFMVTAVSATLDQSSSWKGQGYMNWYNDFGTVQNGYSGYGDWNIQSSGSMAPDADELSLIAQLQGQGGTYYSQGEAQDGYSTQIKLSKLSNVTATTTISSSGDSMAQSYNIGMTGRAAIRVLGSDEKGHPTYRIHGDITGSAEGIGNINREGSEIPQETDGGETYDATNSTIPETEYTGNESIDFPVDSTVIHLGKIEPCNNTTIITPVKNVTAFENTVTLSHAEYERLLIEAGENITAVDI